MGLQSTSDLINKQNTNKGQFELPELIGLEIRFMVSDTCCC